MIYLGQVDSATVDQRHQHHHVPRRSARGGENLQKRGPESKRVRDGEADVAHHTEEETHQEHRGQSAI